MLTALTRSLQPGPSPSQAPLTLISLQFANHIKGRIHTQKKLKLSLKVREEYERIRRDQTPDVLTLSRQTGEARQLPDQL